MTEAGQVITGNRYKCHELHTSLAFKMANIPVGQKQQMVTNIALFMKSGGGGSLIVTGSGATLSITMNG